MNGCQEIRDKAVVDGFLIGVVFSVFVAIASVWLQ